MKVAEINKLFTEKIAEYISNGYIMNPPTMSGHQGEVGKVDLVKGKELIRIWLNAEYSYSMSDPDAWTDKKLVFRVSRWNHEYDERRDRTVWNSELTHIEEYTYYAVGRSNWYLDNLEQALVCVRTRNRRYIENRSITNYSTLVDITSEKSKEIAVNYLKNQHDYQRVSREHIRVFKRVFLDKTSPEYVVRYREKNYRVY